MSAQSALICVRGFGIARLLDRAAELLPADTAWIVAHVVDQRPLEEVERAFGQLPGRRSPQGSGLERIHRSVDQLQQDVQQEVEVWLRDAGRTAELEFLSGVPEHEIVALARERGVDIVVVGSRAEIGPHRFSHVSRFVVDHVPCSVLVVAAESGGS